MDLKWKDHKVMDFLSENGISVRDRIIKTGRYKSVLTQKTRKVCFEERQRVLLKAAVICLDNECRDMRIPIEVHIQKKQTDSIGRTRWKTVDVIIGPPDIDLNDLSDLVKTLQKRIGSLEDIDKEKIESILLDELGKRTNRVRTNRTEEKSCRFLRLDEYINNANVKGFIKSMEMIYRTQPRDSSPEKRIINLVKWAFGYADINTENDKIIIKIKKNEWCIYENFKPKPINYTGEFIQALKSIAAKHNIHMELEETDDAVEIILRKT